MKTKLLHGILFNLTKFKIDYSKYYPLNDLNHSYIIMNNLDLAPPPLVRQRNIIYAQYARQNLRRLVQQKMEQERMRRAQRIRTRIIYNSLQRRRRRHINNTIDLIIDFL